MQTVSLQPMACAPHAARWFF